MLEDRSVGVDRALDGNVTRIRQPPFGKPLGGEEEECSDSGEDDKDQQMPLH